MNSMKIRLTCLMFACFGAALACQKAEPPSPAPESAAAAPAVPAPSAAPATVATAPTVDVAAVPAREDFEEEAQSAITPANLEQQLEALEREVSAE
jgi:hypothetical protein